MCLIHILNEYNKTVCEKAFHCDVVIINVAINAVRLDSMFELPNEEGLECGGISDLIPISNQDVYYDKLVELFSERDNIVVEYIDYEF